MQFRVTRVDIEKTRASWPGGEFAPALILPRDNSEHAIWNIIDKPAQLTDKKTLSWAIASGDEYIRIPLFLYDMSPQGDLALSFMFRLGLICGNLTKRNIKIAHVVTGNPAELVYNSGGSATGLSVWLGAAFVFED